MLLRLENLYLEALVMTPPLCISSWGCAEVKLCLPLVGQQVGEAYPSDQEKQEFSTYFPQ